MARTANLRDQVEWVNPSLAIFLYAFMTLFPVLFSTALVWLYVAVTGAQVSVLWIFIFMMVLRQINVFTLSTLYHRQYSHQQFEYHPVLEQILRVWNWTWMGTGGRAWAILHRWHHHKTDTEEDPHSPTKEGGSVWNIMQQTARSYQHCLHHPELYRRYEGKLPDDALEHAIRRIEGLGFKGLVGVRIPLMIAILWLFLPLPVAVLCLPGVMGSVYFSTVIVVNGLCHTIGYRTTSGAGTATNLFPVDVWGWGEALHHNHHYRPGHANNAMLSWEWDPGYAVLWMLSKVGLVRNLRS
jgi:stearoyl-CoA desaturase (delta-9 desaturase)